MVRHPISRRPGFRAIILSPSLTKSVTLRLWVSGATVLRRIVGELSAQNSDKRTIQNSECTDILERKHGNMGGIRSIELPDERPVIHHHIDRSVVRKNDGK